MERQDSPKIARVEWYINARQRDGGEATLQLDVPFSLLLCLRLLEAGLDDVT